MENKYMKYGLIGGTVLVWGLIIYRVSAGIAAPDRSPVSPPKPHAAAPAVDNDSFVLYADYPDPFIPEKDSVEVMDLKKNIAVSPAPPGVAAPAGPKPPTTLETLKSMFQYVGMIGNPGKKMKIAIVILHGREQLVREKE